MSSSNTPLTDELQSILSTHEFESEVRNRLNLLCARIADLELQSPVDPSLSSNLDSIVQRDVILADRHIKKVLFWLSKRNYESVNAVAFGARVTNAIATTCLQKLLSIGCVELVEGQFTTEKWRATKLGRDLVKTV
ncbi:MAG: hypothetical protein U0930_04715 [Pirellulales bacterium]